MIKNILLILSSDLISKLIGVLSIFMLAKLLSVGEFGRYNYIIMVLTLYAIAIKPFATAYMRDFKFHGYKNYDLSYNIFSIILLVPLGLIFYYILDTVSVFLIFLFAFHQLLIINLLTYLNAFEMYKQYAFLNFLQNFVTLFIVSFFYFFYLNSDTGVEQILIVIYSSILLAYAFAAKKLFKNIIFNINIKNNILFFKSSVFLIGYTMIMPLTGFMDMYFIDNYLSEYDLGLYAFSLKIFAIALVGLSPLLTVLRIKQIDRLKEKNVLEYVSKNFIKVFLSAFAFSVIIIIGAYILTTSFFIEYNESLLATYILIATAFVSYVTIPFSFLMAARRYKEVFVIGVIALMINFIVNFYFIEQFGILAAATSTFLAHSFINITFFILSMIYFKKDKMYG